MHQCHSDVVVPIDVGNRITLTGGYDMDPLWLQGRRHHLATVLRFMPGRNETPALVARLDTPLTVEGYTGDIVILELRYQDALWHHNAVAHIELCNFMPEDLPWQQRGKGRWIESHATVLKGESS